ARRAGQRRRPGHAAPGARGHRDRGDHPVNDVLPPASRDFYIRAMQLLDEAGIGFLVGGAYAFERYTGIARHTKDFDIFVHPRDLERVLETLGAAGCETALPFPHWLGKARCGGAFVDVLLSSGDGVAAVD